MKISQNLQFKTVSEMHNCQTQLLNINCIAELNSKFKSKKLIQFFKSGTKIQDHFAAPIQLQILGEKLYNANLS